MGDACKAWKDRLKCLPDAGGFGSILVLQVAEEGQLDASRGSLAHHVRAC